MLNGFRSKNHPQQVRKSGARDDTDDRRTRADIFEPLNRLHQFTLDAAASPENAKTPRFFTKEQDGLSESWANEVVWCNPPYSNLKAWVAKADFEWSINGCPKIVMLLPANRTEQGWWQDHIEPIRDRGFGVKTEFLRGRRRFDRPEGWKTPTKGDRPPFGLVVVTWGVPRGT